MDEVRLRQAVYLGCLDALSEREAKDARIAELEQKLETERGVNKAHVEETYRAHEWRKQSNRDRDNLQARLDAITCACDVEGDLPHWPDCPKSPDWKED